MAATRPSSTTTFIAVQCFNCSTMQVKQQKKSSNKWTCVVCNEKQSVRKVYARSSLAKDVRAFVQAFNMSRKVADEMCLQDDDVEDETLTEISQPSIDVVDVNKRKKKKTDWSEYLDLDDELAQNHHKAASANAEFEGGIRIVTELPVEMFKKPRLSRQNSSANPKGGGGVGGLYKPSFSKRAATATATTTADNKDGFAASKSFLGEWNRKCGLGVWSKSDDAVRDGEGVGSGAGTAGILGKLGSRWSAYLTQDHEDVDVCLSRADMRSSRADGHGHDIVLDGPSTRDGEEKFEEDIHPDFL